MRPLRLQLENVACFRGKHEPLDLSQFELFAIAGPTGAGKSSLLDALVFALYGRVPRLGASVSELIALGRDRLAVSLDFQSGGRIYRVARALHRGRKGRASEAALEEIVDGEEKPIADGVASVNKALERIVGLGYDAFTQAVILPQGEFQRFLKSRPGERRAILSDLLRLQVYKRMYDRAADEAGRLGAFLQGQQAVLDGEAEAATPEAIAAARAALAEAEAAGRCLRATLEKKEQALLGLRVRRQKTVELEEAERRERSLSLRQDEIQDAARRLSASEKAEALRPRLEASERARSELRSWSLRWEKARRGETEAALTDDAARRELKAAEQAAERLPRLAERLREIDAVSGLLAPLDSARRRLAESRERHERADRELEGARAAEQEARERARAAERAQRTASERLAGSRYDALRHDRLEAHRETALLLGQLRAAVAQAGSEEREAAAEAEAIAGAARRAAQALAAAEKAHKKAAAALADAQQAQRDAERGHAVLHLRSGLRKGDACPVCEQPVARLPRKAALSALDAVRAGVAAAAQDEEAARTQQATRRDELAHADAALRQATARADRARREHLRSQRALEDGESRLMKAVGKDLDDRAKGDAEERLRTALQREATAKAAHETATTESERARVEAERAQQALSAAKDKATALARSLQEHAKAADEADREARELQARIDAVTRGADPAAERTRIAQERTRLAETLQQAQRRERDAAEALLQARLQREQAQHAMADAQRALGDAGSELQRALAEAGFSDAEAAQAAVIDAARRAQLQQAVEEFRRESHAVASRLQELRREVGDGRVGEATLAEANEDAASERRRLEERDAEAARLSERISDLERRAARAQELSASLQRDRRRQTLYQQLATDLRSENFRAFVLEEAFHELVAGASERLLALTGRYAFAFQDDAFHVLDHDNARERRSAETLSGGETFLASLALALELSQQIQRAAGAVHLESLFIDEGFGTLDPEALDTIAGTLEDLPVGGRMVGIITHLPELTERIPNRVRVEKRPEGSRFAVEAA